MLKKSFYVEAEQLRKLELLHSVCPGHPQVASLVREGIDLVIAKYLELEFVKQELALRQKQLGQLELKLELKRIG